MTYDSNLEDPYKLTRFLCSHQDFVESFFGRNIFSNKRVFHATLNALIKAVENGINITGQLVRDLGKYLIVEGAIFILDFYEDAELEDKVYKFVTNQNDTLDEENNVNSIYSDVVDMKERYIVSHRVFGEGKVEKIKDNHISVSFNGDIKKFSFPDAFVNGILKM